ncbi:LRR RECEPTOR-LIKE SERINE/THREONINE-PROTEIN KINASE-RELATED [Salix koriyanagi]|uniref:LRR RECEPTOR-LIKE SERINE/THREONINE-PROTEIN KINASE-RELATED n=1 Tax=Salix koriyanagi TaxID=2511006 RepID=A0A9Q0VEN0_9ROSI|nr:LRR RECEPTOR-LIKE SERINE/THREONINE-PROTEIN KINASE-RELATED [Salix koriyanagi]
MSYRCFGATNCCKGDTTTTTNNNNPGQTKAQEIATDNVKLFSYNSLRSATRNFHPSNRIGAGGFGIVYKGVLRDGTLVAVKSLSVESKQGKDGFVTEIRVISNIKHPNLLELIGCCVEDNNRILIYEYMENNSLSTALLGNYGNNSLLTCLVDISILLSFLFLERRRRGTDIIQETILVYCAKPSFIRTGSKGKHIAMGSKVAFGEDLLVLVEWTWKLWKEERPLDIVDPELTEYPEKEVMRFMKVALFCTQAAANQRPNMKQVVKMLSKDVNLNDKAITEPGVYRTHTSKHSGGGSSVETSSSHKNKSKQSLDVPANSIYFDSSEEMLPR